MWQQVSAHRYSSLAYPLRYRLDSMARYLIEGLVGSHLDKRDSRTRFRYGVVALRHKLASRILCLSGWVVALPGLLPRLRQGARAAGIRLIESIGKGCTGKMRKSWR